MGLLSTLIFDTYNNQRALTRGNTIYMKNNPPGSTTWFSTLVHETTHVWQNQNGGTDYMSAALHAQIFGKAMIMEKVSVRQGYPMDRVRVFLC